MLHFHRFQLANGLTVIFHQDKTTPMAVVNTLYDVGARDEDPNRTGFAHLFEHLMFYGSENNDGADRRLPTFDRQSRKDTGHQIQAERVDDEDANQATDVVPEMIDRSSIVVGQSMAHTAERRPAAMQTKFQLVFPPATRLAWP